jgi:hypothetical protein
MLQECPKPIIGSFEIGAKTFADIKSMCKTAIENGEYDFYEFIPYSSRTKDVTGGFAVDSENRIVYAYGEFKSNGNQGATNDYRTLLGTSPTLAGTFLPRPASANITTLLTDADSDDYKLFGVYIYNSVLYLTIDYGQTITDNQKFIAYGFWQY